MVNILRMTSDWQAMRGFCLCLAKADYLAWREPLPIDEDAGCDHQELLDRFALRKT
jgi:hypothetical protein